MSAILRIKRAIDEEPLNALLLNSKRRRLNTEKSPESCEISNGLPNAESGEISAVLKFAGTITHLDDKATTELAFLNKDAAKDTVRRKRRNVPQAVERMRQEALQRSEENRFHIINCFRKTLGNDDDKEAITIVDIEKNLEPPQQSKSNSGEGSKCANHAEYVYDIYLQNDDQDIENIDFVNHNHLSIHGYDNLVFEDYYINSDSDEYDSEDSNQEDHYKNDYPDEESDCDSESSHYGESDDSYGLRKAIKNFVLDDTEDSNDSHESSEDEDYITFDE